jgi:phenylacetate-CoA ligase
MTTTKKGEIGVVDATDDRFARLKRHIEYAYANTGYYRSTFDQHGLQPASLSSWNDLHRFPFITKEDVIANQEAHRPLGTLVAAGARPLRRIYCTAGSLYFAYTEHDVQHYVEYDSRQWSTLGVAPGDVVDISSAFHWVIAGTIFDAAIAAAGGTVVPGGPGQSEQRVRVMRDLGTTVLQAFTPYAESLGLLIRELGLDPRRDLKVRLLVIGGELRTSEAHKALSELWGGAAIREIYGTSEAGIMAAECFEIGKGMHLNDNIVVEIVDPDTGEPVDPSGGGEIVVTELGREAQPYIRYRTGDVTEGITFEPCACGRPSPRLRRIVGRTGSILRVKGLFVQPQLIARVLEECGCGPRHRIVVERPGTSDELTVTAEDSSRDPDRSALVVRRLKGAIGLTCKVELVAAATLPDGQLVEDRRHLG